MLPYSFENRSILKRTVDRTTSLKSRWMYLPFMNLLNTIENGLQLWMFYIMFFTMQSLCEITNFVEKILFYEIMVVWHQLGF